MKLVAGVGAATFWAWLVFSAGTTLEPIPHAELEAVLNEAYAAAEAYNGEVTGFGIQCDPPSCPNARLMLAEPAPAYEAAMRERFGGRIIFEYGKPVLLGCAHPNPPCPNERARLHGCLPCAPGGAYRTHSAQKCHPASTLRTLGVRIVPIWRHRMSIGWVCRR